MEFRLLKALAANPGHMFSRDQLLDYLDLDHCVVTGRTSTATSGTRIANWNRPRQGRIRFARSME